MSEFSNKILIKKGASKPAASVLDLAELGYDYINRQLYIGNGKNEAGQDLAPTLINSFDETIVDIVENSDLNTFVSPGIYQSANSNISKTLINSPVLNAGFLLKVLEGYSGRIHQFIYGNGNTYYLRGRGNNEVWADWFSLTNPYGITATAAELNILDGVTATTAELNILDGITATTAEINKLDGITVTTAELNYLSGVTSNIQTQLNNKVPITRTINSKALSENITLTASDVSARPSTWVPSASEITSGVLAIARGGTGSGNGATGLGNLFAAGNTILSSYQYGDELPEIATAGRIFFKKVPV